MICLAGKNRESYHVQTINQKSSLEDGKRTFLLSAKLSKGVKSCAGGLALTASIEEIGIKVKLEKYEAGAYYGAVFAKKFRGLLPYVGWYDPEVQAPAELSDFYLKGTPHAYYTTDEIDNALRKGMYATTDEELTEWGRKLSRMIREDYVTVFLWANHSPYSLGPRIKNWKPSLGSLPAIAFETIELK